MSALKRIWNILTTLLVIIVVMLAIALVGVRLVGLQPFTVLSGSMEPTYHTGSLIYVKSVDCHELKVGDPITFLLDEKTVATHRIVEIVPDEENPEVLRFKTKGDANENEDGGLVHDKNVLGRPVFTIPQMGYIANFIQNPPGTYYTVMIGGLLLLLMFLPELIKAISSDDKDRMKNDGEEKAHNAQNRAASSNEPVPKVDVTEEKLQHKKSKAAVKQTKHFTVGLPTRKKGKHEL